MRRSTAYLKMRILGAVENAEGRTRQQRIKNVSNLVFIDEDGNKRKFTWRTISTWYYRYKSTGVVDLIPKVRKDKGYHRKTTPEELLEAINQVIPFFREGIEPKRSAIYRLCIEKGILRKESIAQTTFYRLVREYDLLDKDDEIKKIRMAFSMQYANDLWQADTMFGPFIHNGKKNVQAKLIAFIDDASRIICHGQFYFNENIDTLIETLKNAFYKRGLPKQIYVDNGSIYCSKELNLVCARLGCILSHTPVRDGAAKGKIERFFRTVRDQFLIRNLDLSSIESLNKQFHEWVENSYNSSTHSVLKMAPIDRFAIDRSRVTFLPPSEISDELFYAEDTRKVLADNTFSFNSKRYEAPSYLGSKSITIRYQRSKNERVIVYYKGERIGEANILDLHINSQVKRGRK